VEAVVAGYGGEDEAVAQEGSQGDGQEEHEVQEPQLARVCECQQEELAHRAAVGHLLTLDTGIFEEEKKKNRTDFNEENLFHLLESPQLSAALLLELWVVLAACDTGSRGCCGLQRSPSCCAAGGKQDRGGNSSAVHLSDQ